MLSSQFHAQAKAHPRRHLRCTLALLLAAMTLAAFWKLPTHDFVSNYDDELYVTRNRHVQAGLTRESAAWAFTTGYACNWHPLTWLSHMLDCELYGLNPRGHHISNLLFHVANTVLLFLILSRMTGAVWRSAFVAALFAVHPLHVESVALVAQRKDVLSTFFWILTMWAYARYVDVQRPGRYLPVIVLFALGLMAKPMLVTLPFVLLLLDYWPLGRIGRGPLWDKENRRICWKLIFEKLPLLALSAASCAVTFLAQQKGTAVVSLGQFTLRTRAASALVAYVRYIGKMLWPVNLAAYYPHPGDTLPVWLAIAAAVLLLCASAVAFRLMRRRPYVSVGWLWYLGTLIPVIGIVQVGNQAIADRYTYVPLIGLFIILGWAVPDLVRNRPRRKTVLAAAATAVLVALVSCTLSELPHWRNSVTLFERTLRVTSNNVIAHNNLGGALMAQGKVNEAVEHFSNAIRINPNYDMAHHNLAMALVEQGNIDEAVDHFSRALEINPNDASTHNALGMALTEQGKIDEAAAHYAEAIRLEPDYVNPHVNLGVVLARQGNAEEAIESYKRALEIEPQSAEAHVNLGNALARQGKYDEAVLHYSRAVRIRPDDVLAHYNLGNALERQGKLTEALMHFRVALRVAPDFEPARNKVERVQSELQNRR